MKIPKLYETKKGKKYFKFFGRRIYVGYNITSKDLQKSYALLSKVRRLKRKPKKKTRSDRSLRATATIKQNIISSERGSAPMVIHRDGENRHLEIIREIKELQRPPANPNPPTQAVSEAPVQQGQPIANPQAPTRAAEVEDEGDEDEGEGEAEGEAEEKGVKDIEEDAVEKLTIVELAELEKTNLSRELRTLEDEIGGSEPTELQREKRKSLRKDLGIITETVQKLYDTLPLQESDDVQIENLSKQVDMEINLMRPYVNKLKGVTMKKKIKELNASLPVSQKIEIPATDSDGKFTKVQLKALKDKYLEGQKNFIMNQRLLDLQARGKIKTGRGLSSAFRSGPPPFVMMGEGKHDRGLYDDEITSVMKTYPEFLGTISRDEIKNILPKVKPGNKVAFIINLDPSSKRGSHWNAVFIDPVGSKSIEWFDSFGREIPADILKDIKLIVDILKPNTLLKLKVNRVVQQSDDTSNCGYFALRFLIDRLRGKSFSEATGYDEKMKHYAIEKNEKEIERLKLQPPFSYINHDLVKT